jgi:hypothetical protein
MPVAGNANLGPMKEQPDEIPISKYLRRYYLRSAYAYRLHETRNNESTGITG